MLLGFRLVTLSAVPPVALVMDVSFSEERGAKFTAPPPRLNRNNLNLINQN